jgi:hypothetical protein
MSTKLAWRLIAAGALLLCTGCGTSGKETSCDPCSTPAAQPAGSAAHTRDRLLRKTNLSGSEKLELANAWMELGEPTSAETAYFGALSRGGLTPAQTFQAQMGLARVAEQQGQRYSARSRYAQAWKLGPDDRAKDDALVALSLAEIQDGDLAGAREHRRAISDPTRPELAEIDRKLGAERVVGATAKSGGRAAAPGGRGIAPPKFNGREVWNAKPMSMRGDPEPMGKITRVTLHHTADPRPVGVSFAAVAERMRAYQNGHQVDNRWADIGYHFIVDQKGRIWEGRELNWKGAHAGNKEANENNVGISLIGNFENSVPTAEQVTATEDLLIWLSQEYGIPSSRIYTHNEIERLYGIKGTTCCPGKRFGPSLAKLKAAVDRAQRAPAAMH